MTKNVDRLAKAVAIVDAGFAIKAKAKEASDDLNAAYEDLRRVVMDACLNITWTNRNEGHEENKANNELYWAMPSYPHQFKAKHADMIRGVHGDSLETTIKAIEDIVSLREDLKAVEIVKVAPKEVGEETQFKARALKSFDEVIAERKSTFDWSVKMMEYFAEKYPQHKNMGVSAHAVYCSNEHGTRWVRIDWFMAGRKTPFNIIQAAMQKVKEA